MGKIVNSFFDKLFDVKNMRFVLLFMLFMMFTPQIGYQMNVFYKIYHIYPYCVFVWVALVFINDFLKERKFWNATGVTWLVLFLISYVISAIVNHKYNFVDNIQLVFWMAIQFFLVSFYDRNETLEKHKKGLEQLASLFIGITFVLVVGGLIMFFCNYAGEITSMDGTKIRSGFRSFRLFGLYHSPNYGALFACISIIGSVYFFVNKKSIAFKIFNVFNIIVQYIYIILSVSRTGKLCLFLTIAAGVPILVYYLIENFKIKHLVLSIFIGIALGASAIFMFKPVGKVMSSVANEIDTIITTAKNEKTDSKENSNISNNEAENKEQSKEDVQVDDNEAADKEANVKPDTTEKIENKTNVQEKPDVELKREDLDVYGVSNNRFVAWKEQITLLFFEKPLFGATSLGNFKYAKEKHPDSFIVKHKVTYCENDFIKLPVYSGIVGTTIFLIYVILVITKIIRYIYKQIKADDKSGIMKILVPLLVLMIFFVTMFFSDAVLMNFTIESVMFWSLIGYVLYIVDPNPKSNFVKTIIDKIYFSIFKNKKSI